MARLVMATAAVSCTALASISAALATDRQSRSQPSIPRGITVMLTKFERLSQEPILGPRPGKFDDAGAFNPTAALDNGRTILLYRGQDKHGISRVGYAKSDDGVHFKALEEPVLSPTEPDETDGIEDPRLCRDPLDHRSWILTATAYNKTSETAQLVGYRPAESSPKQSADSHDHYRSPRERPGGGLLHWRRTGIIMPCGKGTWNVHWTKSGAMVTDDNGLPLKIGGRFYMYYMGDAKDGHDQMGLACAKDGLNWQDATDKPVLPHRPGMFDSKVVEPGPHTIITKDGILLIYNGADDTLTYRTGWALFDKKNPAKLIARAQEPLFEPETSWEKKTASTDVYQAPNVVFVEGIVPDGQGGYRVYYGSADSYVGVAHTTLRSCR
jgi:predicted GH43/DUF377 family glycosyl hydrolase